MIYVMSDIHGNKDAFESILNQINLRAEDELYILGDIIDRQKYGVELIQRIMKMDNVHMLLGNHEYMMMDSLGFPYEPDGCTKDISVNRKMSIWLKNGGDATYASWMLLSEDEKEDIKKYLKNLPVEYDVSVNGRNFKLVHSIPLCVYDLLKEDYPNRINDSRVYFSVWDRTMIDVMIDFDEFITIFGHTPTIRFTQELPMKIYCNNNIIGIDCGAAYADEEDKGSCRLACLRLDDMKEFYSN